MLSFNGSMHSAGGGRSFLLLRHTMHERLSVLQWEVRASNVFTSRKCIHRVGISKCCLSL